MNKICRQRKRGVNGPNMEDQSDCKRAVSPEFIHKEAVERLRRLDGCDSSAHAFASIFIWKQEMGLKLLLEADFYAVRCEKRGENVWFFPVGTEDGCRRFLERHWKETDFQLVYITEEQKQRLEHWFPDAFQLTREEAADEYLCDTKAHQQMSGKLYANARTQWNKAVREHRLELERVDAQNIADAWQVLLQWQPGQAGIKKAPYDDAERKMLTHYRDLDMELYLLRVDNEVFSVIGGYPLTETVFDMSIAKERRRQPGLGYAAKHLFFGALAERYPLVNIEEDLGIEGLRFMKSDLAPVHKKRMWTAKRSEI